MKKSSALQNLYLRLPRPISSTLYGVARRFVFKDPRRPDFAKTFRHVAAAGVPGDYLEFGVFRGTSFIACYKEARRNGLNAMRFFAFDSFEGLPNDEGGLFHTGEFKFPADRFLRSVTQAGVDESRVRIVRGMYDQSLTEDVKREHDLRRAAVVHVDCDLYTSTQCVLQFVEDLVGVGTVIIFDDWHAFRGREDAAELGERRAFEEWPLAECFEPFYDTSHPAMFCKAFVMTRLPTASGPSDTVE